MIGKIIEIINNIVTIELSIDMTNQPNIIGLHIVFEDQNKRILGEVQGINKSILTASIIGEFVDNQFFSGSVRKPAFRSTIRMINAQELEILFGKQTSSIDTVYLGNSNVYENYPINVPINSFFSNHFSILGNSGSGKSFTVAALFQRLFTNDHLPIGANIFLFDAYGEYTTAFNTLHEKNPKLNYKVYTTNTKEKNIIRIPIWLLDVDDLALLLNVTTPNQLPIIEKTLKLVPILIGNNPEVIKHKNDIIARAVLDILLSGAETTKICDQVIAILTKFNTQELNLESKIIQPGYTRSLKQCLYIDKTGKMQEMELVVNFISSFIDNQLSLEAPSTTNYYTLNDLEEAMEFALISEGMLKSDKVYDIANVLLVRLHSLANTDSKEYFSYPTYINRASFIEELLTNENKAKSQIINFNISYIDDRLAKVITKILSRMLFKQAIMNENRGSVPFHIMIEEAHRYVQKDTDSEILGYNIFERITKEGRKYGVILGLITQRPSELSDTVISQCSNFLILRMSHPKDLDYIKTMVPMISEEVVGKIKNQKAGSCIAFGSAFKIPTELYVIPPSPTPLSNNVNIVKTWHEVTEIGAASTMMAGGIPEMNVASNNKIPETPQPMISDQQIPSPTIRINPNNLMN